MKTLSVSTLLTAAALAICLSNIAQADSKGAPPIYFGKQPTEREEACADPKSKLCEAYNRSKMAGYEKTIREGELGDCKEQRKEFDKANEQYGKSCGKALPLLTRMKSIIGAPDEDQFHDKCAAWVNQCNNPKASDDPDPDGEGESEGGGLRSSSSSSARGSSAGMSELMADARMCTVPSGASYKDAKDSLKDYRRERSRLEKEGREAQVEIAEVGNQIKTERNKLDDRAESMKLKIAEKQREILAQKTSKENQIKAAVVQAEGEMTEIELAVERIRLSQSEADIALAEAIGQLERQCHADALAKVEEHRKQILKQMESSTYTPGGQENLFSGVGKSMKAKFKKLATDYFKDCKDSDITRTLMSAAKNRKALATARAETEIQGLNKKLDRARDRIKELQTTERTSVLNETAENLKALQAEVEAQGKKLTNARDEIGSEAGIKMMKAQQKMTNINADLDRERLELGGDQAIVDMAKRIGLSPDSKSDDILDAKKDLGMLRSLAYQTAVACCDKRIDIGDYPTPHKEGQAVANLTKKEPAKKDRVACDNACRIGDFDGVDCKPKPDKDRSGRATEGTK